VVGGARLEGMGGKFRGRAGEKFRRCTGGMLQGRVDEKLRKCTGGMLQGRVGGMLREHVDAKLQAVEEVILQAAGGGKL